MLLASSGGGRTTWCSTATGAYDGRPGSDDGWLGERRRRVIAVGIASVRLQQAATLMR
ncbi:hypothetical protein ACLOJK_037642 [Asimina triloba]